MVGIVIVNYKTNSETINFVKSELSKIKIPSKIVIVNNDCEILDSKKYSDELNALSVEAEERLVSQDREVYLINSKVNLGFARGNNLGAEFLLRNFVIDYILFTNNDIIIKTEDVIDKLIAKIETLPSVALIGPKMIDLSGKLISPRYDKVSPLRFILHYLFYPVYSSNILTKLGFNTKGKKEIESRKLYENYCYWIAGSFMLMVAKDFIDIKGFDPNTFLYSEEKILAERLIKIGKKVYYYGEPVIISIGGLTTSKYLKNKTRDKLIFNSDVYYYKRYINISKFTQFIMLFSGYFYFSIFYRNN